ncbi:MAG TPA: DUF512 domain-containing protein [Eubacteriales bacterium]|nr:DUF512 domain-containing protein [Eubacteriales bacterium]
MENMRSKPQIVSDVLPGSPAERFGVTAGEALMAIDGEPVIDLVDYEHLSANEVLRLTIADKAGKMREVKVKKEEYEPLGLSFATSLMDGMRTCKNHCVFCFIDQMPDGGRTSLHVKDDDWRMSFIMGNYITLTNLDDREIGRIIRRRVSPLYISLHASDPKTRVLLMRNPTAGRAMEQLRRLADAGLKFHLQAVLCPGVNDGEILQKTMEDAVSLAPAAQSLALVPVGITKFRDGLFPLRRYTADEAREMIDTIEPMQAAFLKKLGTRFAFLADEWYTLAARKLPPYEAYEDFVQIENGVGLLRLFEREMLDALAEKKPLRKKRRFLMAGGVAAEPFFRNLYPCLLPYGVEIETRAIQNTFFGECVTVGGLITGGDLTRQLKGSDFGEALLIPRAMLKADEPLFLDNMTLEQAETILQTRILPVFSGEELIETVFGSIQEKRL